MEVKKSVLGEGVKSMHLTYLGDARVGSGTNIGAGTITCNYDGVHKNPTTIGKRVFIGSDTALVAPVRVGDGAYVGAGSVITEKCSARCAGPGARAAGEQARLGRRAPPPTGRRRQIRARRKKIEAQVAQASAVRNVRIICKIIVETSTAECLCSKSPPSPESYPLSDWKVPAGLQPNLLFII